MADSDFTTLLLLTFGVLAYCSPVIIALFRQATNLGFVFILNIFFGWSGICWIISFIMACSANSRSEQTQKLNDAKEIERLQQELSTFLQQQNQHRKYKHR